jgi:hypothetical protein
MQAEVRVVASHLRLVQSQDQIAAAVSGDLFIDGKRVLIIKGASAAEAVEKIYKEFSVRRDLAGNPFRLSHRERGIMATDQWGEGLQGKYSRLQAFHSIMVLAGRADHLR